MFRYASDQSVLFDADPRNVDLEALARIPGVVNLHPAYASVLIVFDPLQTTHAEVQEAAERLESGTATAARKRVEIPVRYDGPDLENVAALHGMALEQVIALHSSAVYSVAFVGFVPGFAYLTGLPQALWTPRLAAPRKVVPAGSVGIAGEQTGVYPIATPGGWQLIGTTETVLFDAAREPMSLLATGDEVVFRPV